MADESKHRDRSSIDKDLGKDERDIGSRVNEGMPKDDLSYQGNKNDKSYGGGKMDRDKDMTRNPGDMNRKDIDQKNSGYGNEKGKNDYRK